MLGLLLLLLILMISGTIVVLILPDLGVASAVIGILAGLWVSFLTLRFLQRQTRQTMTFSEFRERFPRDWEYVKGQINDQDTIVCYESGPLSWRLMCGRKRVCVVRNGVEVAIYKVLN